MRYIEIILKLVFLGESIYFFITKSTSVSCWYIYLAICAVLGVVLIFNKDASYHFPQSKRDLMIRRIEGVILVAFAFVAYFVIYGNA